MIADKKAKNSMIAVVTGASGFIGSHLVNLLVKEGFIVRCLDVKNKTNSSVSNHMVENFYIDCTKFDMLLKTRALEGADYIFHLAGGTKLTKLEAFRKYNVLSTRNILEAVAERRIRLKRFVFVSSQAAVGPAFSMDRPVIESDKQGPVGDYGRSKWEAEQVVLEYGNSIPYTIIRPSSVYGPGDVDFLNIFKQIKVYLSIYPGYKDRYVTIIFVTDLVHGLLLAARAFRAEGKTYFLCSENPVSWCDVHRMITSVMNKKVMELNIPQLMVELVGRVGDIFSRLTGRFVIFNTQKITMSKPRYWICSSERAKKDFGFKTGVSMLEGMDITCSWYKENKWL